MVQFYKNRKQNFECSVKITGTNPELSKARLILYPDDDSKAIFFEGKIKDTKCIVEVYPNININAKGKAVLEVIVDESVVFSPWNSTYELLSKEIQVESTNVTKSTSSGVSVKLIEDVKVAKEVKPKVEMIKPVAKPEKKVVKEEKKKESGIDMDELYQALLKEVDSSDKKHLKEIVIWQLNKAMTRSDANTKKMLELYKKSVLAMDNDTITEIFKYVKKDYEPKKESINLIKKMKLNEMSNISKLLMYFSEIK